MGFLMFVLGNSILSWAETRIDSGLAALLVGAIPLWVVILERLKPWGTRREITLQKAVGVGVGLFGLGMLVWPGSAASGIRFDVFTAGILTVGAVAWAVGTVAGPVIPHPADKVEGAAMTMLTGGAMIALVALVRGEFSTFDIDLVSAQSVAAWAYLVVFGSMIAYTAYSYLVSTVEAGKIATYALVNPIVAVLLGWAVMGERVTPRMITATLVIVLGLALTIFGGEAAAWAGRQVGKTARRQVREVA
jgi:drug/metabolite transporter (DMT)-like permease